MATTFVSRHDGAIEWAREEGYLAEDTIIASDFDAESTVAGDLIIGTLPAPLAARICERGGRYQHLTLDLAPDLRGIELSAAQMRACNARLEEFHIQRSAVTVSKKRKITHLCLVSDQCLQNLLPARVETYVPDRCVLILSAEMKKKGAGKRLRHALEQAGCKNISMLEDIPDHDVGEIAAWGNRAIARLRAEYPDQNYILNLTGGNKLMAFGLLQALRPWCEAIYCDTANDMLETLHPPGKPPTPLSPDLVNVKLYLAAQGFNVRQEKRDAVQLDRRRDITVWLAHNAHGLQELIRKLNGAAAYYKPGNRSAQTPNLPAPSAGLEHDAHQRLLDAGILEEHDGKRRIPAPYANYLGGGWLEEYCWAVGRALEGEGMLKRARFDINVKIDPIDQAGSDRYPLNELDAVFVHRNRMLIAECKTGRQLGDDDKSQNILNRLEVLGEHAAGRFSTKVLLSSEHEIDAKTAKRASRYQIRVLAASNLPDLKKLVAEWMRSDKTA